MQQQKIAIVLNGTLEKGVIWLASAVHDDRLVTFFSTSEQQQGFLLVEVLSHLIEKIECQSVDVNNLFCVRENELTDGLLLFDEFACPPHRYVGVNILSSFLAQSTFAQLAIRVIDQLVFFDKMDDAVRRNVNPRRICQEHARQLDVDLGVAIDKHFGNLIEGLLFLDQHRKFMFRVGL